MITVKIIQDETRMSDDSKGNLEIENKIGWFFTSSNVFGWSLYKLDEFDITWLTGKGFDCSNIFRICSHNGNISIVKINFVNGRIQFFDNTYYVSTDMPKFDSQSYKMKDVKMTKKAWQNLIVEKEIHELVFENVISNKKFIIKTNQLLDESKNEMIQRLISTNQDLAEFVKYVNYRVYYN